MARITESQVLDALRQVQDPDRGKDIVALGMVSGIAIREGHVAFSLEIEPARAARLEPVRRAAAQAVEALDGVLSASAVLTAASGDKPPAGATYGHGPAHGQAAGRPAGRPAPPAKPLVPGVKAIVAVASGKGGVGKSTTAVNLACALAASGLRVGLLDADVYGPSLPRLMGIDGKPRSSDGHTMEPLENYGVKCMSIGFLVPPEQATIWRGPMVMGALQQMLRDVNWGELDILLVDMPPGTGDAQLTMAQQVPLAGAVVVSTPQDIALIDARKGIAMFEKVEVPVLGIVENMSYFCCPNCGHRSDIFSHGGARAEAEKLKTDFLGEIPLDIAIRETSDGGRPLVVADPASPQAASYRAIAERIRDKVLAPAKRGFFRLPKIRFE